MDINKIRRSLIKKYRRELWVPFIKALKEFEMVNEEDHIAVCFSGGKDSIVLSLLMLELHRYSSTAFKLSIISMDPGFSAEVKSDMNRLIRDLGLEVQIFEAKLFDTIKTMDTKTPCFMCARMRRGFLYERAREIGANKIALGHHMDDVAETVLMNILYQGKYMTMMPKIDSLNFKNMQLIRPMYYIEECSILKYMKYNDIVAIPCSCDVALGKSESKRDEVKALIKHIESFNKNAKTSIVNSAKNVCFDAIIDKRYSQ